MKKHNYFVKLATLALALVLTLSLTACGGGSSAADGSDAQQPVIKIGVPNDTTNEARARCCFRRTASSSWPTALASPPPRTTSWRIRTTSRSWRPRPLSSPTC